MNIELSDFYSRLGTIAIILLLGFFLGKKKLINNKTNKDIINLLLMVFMPASLFVAFPSVYSEETSRLFLSGLAAGIVVMLSLIIVSRIIFAKGLYKGELRFESQFAFVFNNATFLGYPIVSSTFGEQGVVPYCGFIIAFNLALFSYGVYLFERRVSKELLRGIVTNPNIIAVLLGVLVFVLGIPVPSAIKDAVTFTGNATTALSIICIGFMLSHADFKKLIKKWRLILTASIQLILGPLVTFLILITLNDFGAHLSSLASPISKFIGSIFYFPEQVVVVCTLIQALPTATSLGLFAAKYGGNDIEASELVTISTILSMVTMPIMIVILLIK